MQLEPLFKCDLQEIVSLLERGYADFPVTTSFNVAEMLDRIRIDGLDLLSSRLVLDGGKAVAVALIARRGWRCRLADMAVLPEARRLGIGRWLVKQLILEAKERGEKSMVLEVLDQNTTAFRLYKAVAFRPLRQLVSYTGFQTSEGKTDTLEEVDLGEVAQRVSAYGLEHLPWQLSGESLAQLGPPNRGYRMEDAYMAISDPKRSRIALRSVVVKPQARGRGQASRLLGAVMEHHGAKEWEIPALCPAELGPLFEKAGFIKSSFTQFQMIFPWT
jgi:ribosomal protein S18 acetylase RimI-like enzyme